MESNKKTLKAIIPPISQEIDNLPISKNKELTYVNFGIREDLMEKVKDYIYGEGLTQAEFYIHALEEFFKDRIVTPRPEKVKLREKKRGRKKRQ